MNIGLWVVERNRFLANGAGVDGCEGVFLTVFGVCNFTLVLVTVKALGESAALDFGVERTSNGAPCSPGLMGDMLSGAPVNSAPPATTVEFFRAGYRFDGLIPVFPDFRLNLLDSREEYDVRLDFADNSSTSSSSTSSVDFSSSETFSSLVESRSLGGVSSTLCEIKNKIGSSYNVRKSNEFLKCLQLRRSTADHPLL
jgi:hypothetical protein